MFNKKRGQAAMEFLMTYGWAILAAVIVVGVLWYMIGNPANLAGNNFQMSAPFASNGVSIPNSTYIGVEFRNGAGETVTIANVSTSTANCGAPTAPGDISSGEIASVWMVCSGLTTGDKVADTVTVTFTKGSGTLAQTATGSLTGVVP